MGKEGSLMNKRYQRGKFEDLKGGYIHKGIR